ncbi:deacetylase [Bacillus sp. FJAT-27916]|uniref:bacillithiol biosynthesis deacetylase BshB2 n=1 Tax=Bacillus sp. FJAT-27916 TaxID=1679169 RepID=UPI000670ACFD|nr:bacillithiol biosynthesis deacetylase BshB2 [Bacillus sp. FJAT-27916]KMY42899.1 deacetylase [Bacillus sp. FJAT-27916]
METERHVLVIFPHPDDEAFGVSGTIASYTKNNTPVTYICLTLGEMGRNLGNPPFATRESLPNIRRQELMDAANVMGIQDLRMWGLRDKTVEFENEEALANRIRAAIEEVNPSLIITFYPGFSVHPDHEATGRAVVRAVGSMDKANRPKLYCVAFSNNHQELLGKPDVVHFIQDVIETKLAAIAAHRSQTEAMMASWPALLEQKNEELESRLFYERFYEYKWAEDIR